MPIEFIQQSQPAESSSDTARLSMMYDGSGRRISKTVMHKVAGTADWDTVKVTHYIGIGTEVREEFHNGTREKVNMPQGLGRYGIEGAFSFMVIDGAFILAGSKFAPGGRITKTLVGGSYKRAADNALQNILNFGTHEIDGMLRQINDIPMDMAPEKSSSMAPMEDDN
jgi:YD repeat-containing protein